MDFSELVLFWPRATKLTVSHFLITVCFARECARHNQLLFQLTRETLIGTHNRQIRVVEHSSVERREREKSEMRAVELAWRASSLFGIEENTRSSEMSSLLNENGGVSFGRGYGEGCGSVCVVWGRSSKL